MNKRLLLRSKRHTFLEWDRFQVDLQYTLKVPMPALVRLASSHILQLLGMIALGVGAMPLNVQAKLKHDEDNALVIKATQTKYSNAFKGV
jgi:hypothetical protein